jgi:hypothetical protein
MFYVPAAFFVSQTRHCLNYDFRDLIDLYDRLARLVGVYRIRPTRCLAMYAALNIAFDANG